MCYNESMKRIDILKGIEYILVQKAYGTGYISHRADGDWQKQADGSWKPYKGQSDQSAPQAQEPTESAEYGEIVKQDFESVPNSIKDKMFTIAQQYQSEWAEDGDEDVRSMAENDVEDTSRMLWDNADEETRNSWIGSEDSPATNNEYGEITDEDIKMSPKQLTRHLLKNGDYDSAINQIEFEEDDDGVPFTYDNDFELIVDNVMSDMGMSSEEKKVNRGAVSRAIMDRALQLRKPAEHGIQKSAVRDMRSTPTTKNMGF